jgi:cellulose synthase/poly-beta-1,6-N-acetylglucosamine synthase-like glycosyltransferase
MKISFVIPAYNEEAYIGKCLDAIFREIDGRNDTEVIVVDNNSTDHTAEVVARYPKARLIHETRRGANSAREAGFRTSTGELVAFPDADTDMPAGWVEKAEHEFANDPTLVCISGPFILYDLPPGIQLLVRVFYGLTYVIYHIGKLFLRKTTVIQGGNYMLRRWALEEIGGQNVSLTFYGDDTDLAIRLSRIGKVKFTFKLPIRSSGRRLAKEGAFTMGLRYGINNLWMALFRRPFTTNAKEVRLTASGDIYSPENKAKEWTIIVIFLACLFAVVAGVAYLIYWLIR